ncbi:MAG: hypothetical protein KA502_01175 [Candidatus Methanomethylophilaceae archaeon]|nr:hypothetical protein [Candidatus Methanomethylophilaceae archaeon]
MKIGRKAMIGFPMRLAVAFLILSISLPVITGMAEDLKDDNRVGSTTAEAEKISDAISKVYYSGVGSIRTVEVSIDSHCFVKVGGAGSQCYSIGVYLEDMEKGRIYLQRPPVKIVGDGVEISGDTLVSVKCVRMADGCGVEVSVA